MKADPSLALRRAVGNQAVQRLMRQGPAAAAEPLEAPPGPEQAPDEAAESRHPAERQASALGAGIGEALRGVGPVPDGELPSTVRRVAEAHLGVPLEGTELRAGVAGQSEAEGASALAVARGSRVSFAPGRLDTSTAAGRALLGHELTHVAQQRAAGRSALQRQPAPASQPPSAALLQKMNTFLDARADPDVKDLVKSLRLTSTGAQVVKTVRLGTVNHKFRVTLTWEQTGMEGRTAEGAQTADTHDISVTVGRSFGPRSVPETRKDPTGKVYPYWELKTGDERSAFLLAERLSHELTHVLILIGNRIEALSPGYAQHSPMYRRYQSAMQRATSPADLGFQQLRKDIHATLETKLGKGAYDGGKFVPRADRLDSDTEKFIEFLVNEQFTYQQVGKRFGYTPTDKTISEAYVETWVNRTLMRAWIADAVKDGKVQAQDADNVAYAVKNAAEWGQGLSTMVDHAKKALLYVSKPMDMLGPGFITSPSGYPPPSPVTEEGKPVYPEQKTPGVAPTPAGS